VAITWAVVGLAGLLVLALAVPRLVRAAGEGEGARQVATRTAEPTDEPSTAPSAEPTPSPPGPSPSTAPIATATATDGPAGTPTGTVLFRGGPATGPWQQLGTVAEITHPDAPATARYSYTNFWTDPAEENQPDELWDQLVTEVTAQLAELGTPVDRPAFGGAPGSEPFNSFGGMEDVYREDGVFTAYWSAVVEDDLGVAQTYFHYVIDFAGNVVERREPVLLRDAGGRTHQDNVAEHLASLRAWADELGFSGCEAC
jgi:hypothetical protein